MTKDNLHFVENIVSDKIIQYTQRCDKDKFKYWLAGFKKSKVQENKGMKKDFIDVALF